MSEQKRKIGFTVACVNEFANKHNLSVKVQCRLYKDFGQGFYLTDIEEQAQNMPIAVSQYWNCIHGRELREADRDEEGKQTMRVLARNMTFLMKSIELGKKQFGLPEKEEHAFTHFIRQRFLSAF